MAGVITASEPSWIGPFTGLSPRQFNKLITALRREGADPVRKGRPWSLPLEDRVLLVAAYWRTNLTLRQLGPLFAVSKSAADRIVDHLGPALALQPRRRFRRETVLIVDGTLAPTRDRTVAAPSKNYRYSTNHQVVIDADTRLVVTVGTPLPGNRNDCRAWQDSGAKARRQHHPHGDRRRRLPGHRPDVQVAAQSYAWFAGFVGGAVRRRDRPPCGEQFLDGERCLVIGGGDFHDCESRFGHVPVVDRLHTRHDAQAPAGVRASGQRHPTGYGATRVLTVRRELHEVVPRRSPVRPLHPHGRRTTKTRQRPLRGR